MSATWLLSETETKALRDADDAPSETTVFRKNDLIAMTYCDPNGYWHLLLSVQHDERHPELEEVLDARRSLLPGIENFAIEAGVAIGKAKWEPPVALIHLVELRDASEEVKPS